MVNKYLSFSSKEWSFHLVFWCAAMLTLLIAWSNNQPPLHIITGAFSTVITFIMPFYINVKKLLPQYFDRKDWLKYGGFLILLLGLAKAINTMFILSPWMIQHEADFHFGREFSRFLFREFRFLDKWIFSQTVWIVIGSFGYYFVRYWMLNEKTRSATATDFKLPEQNARFFFVHTGRQQTKIVYDEILFIVGDGNYVTYHLQHAKVMVRAGIKETILRLSSSDFIQVHRSSIVALKHIDKIQDNHIFISDKRIPIGPSYKDSFHAVISRFT